LKPVTSERHTELCGSRHHQGMAAQMGPFPYRSLEDLDRLLQSVSDCEVPPVILICDRIQDAHNLGAILRSCDAMAVTAVIIGEREQVGVTAQVARSSAGAVNYVPIIRVESLDDAASEKSSTPVWNMDASVGIALIIGSESHGVADTLLAKSDGAVSIPMAGKVSSLNAAVAAGMLLYELRRDGD
jgi:23S rRNA (guanosine2251-2'-O)-methyltransferase